ncbi:hypothetical protein AXG93_154s1830 [Marchantia polymorpha subsp. ruderalis]|uniref:Septum formation inhibitor MinC C-terminal domain-containing protein n=1 Tax=Marchantia polymorpha subsp. ruderalis TaxID=1480154 RepID=A0A176VIE0_MARPO|nr:hypothetical protein AXG93_154s1830 [Marchantia polymorpha subsp. ruderalis]
MASHLLLAMSGTSPSWASQFGSPNCCIEARKRLPAARSCTPITSSTRGPHVQTCGINYTGSRFRRILEVVLDDYGTKYRKRELQASRSMRPDDVNGEDAWSSGHIEKEKCGAGGETTCECLYLKRTICDGEIVEHSGSIIIQGDVSPGGCVLAGGDVIVLGRLQGVVQAGRAGEHPAKVFMAFQDHGVIKIGDEATLQLANSDTCVPQVAMLAPDGGILSEPYWQWYEKSLHSLSFQGHSSLLIFCAKILILTNIAPNVTSHLQVFGVYYIGTAVGDLSGIRGAEAFYYSTIVGRIFIFLSFAWLVFVRAVPSALLIVGTVNLVGALLMWRALLKQDHE